MIYTLCHKDIPVLTFKTDYDEVSEIISVLNPCHLPVGIFKEYDKNISLTQQFRTWWRSRAIPASRQNLNDALELLGNITTEQLVTKSFGLSLSDQYWANPDSSGLSWHDVNFFENDFSDDVGKALFGTLDVHDISSLSLLSPDNTSDGWLKKKWIIDNGDRVLLKGGSGESQQEPFNEVLAAEICKRLGIPHVDYSIAEHDGRYYSACKDFINGNTELVSAWHVKNVLRKDKNESEYQHLLRCCQAVGMSAIPDIEKQLCRMFVVDSIIANTDRHFNNFGFVRNADTLAWIGLAPVFDTGTSLFHDFSAYDLQHNSEHINRTAASKPFAKTHQEQLKKLPCSAHCRDLPFEKLSGIETFAQELFSHNRHMSEKKNNLCTILAERARETERLIRKPEPVQKRYKRSFDWER